MTVQIPEKFVFGKAHHSILGKPLADYFTLGGQNPGLRWQSTACWRGYIGTWELIERRLYLIRLTDYLSLVEGHKSNLSLATLFADYPERVFAHWYSGTLLVPVGQKLQHMSYAFPDIREQTLLLSFERGVLQSAHLRYNDQNEPEIILGIAEALNLLTTATEDKDDQL